MIMVMNRLETYHIE